MTLCEKYRHILSELPPTAKLIVVSKNQSVASIRELYALGCRDFGENRVQETLEKQEALKDLAICWHYLGELQSNKLKLIAAHFAWVHSLDDWNKAVKLNTYSQALNKTLKVLWQVKLLPDPSKGGLEEEQIWAILQKEDTLQNLDFAGLMSILPQGLRGEQAFQAFLRLAELKAKLSPNLTELSIGMSEDYREALRAGSTMIRIGRGIFASSSVN